MAYAAPRVRTRLLAAGKTDVGRRREANEDNILLRPEHQLFAVADGMGGHKAGDVASGLAARALASFFEAQLDPDRLPQLTEAERQLPLEARRLVGAVHQANADVVEMGAAAMTKGMGSTVVAMYLPAGAGTIHVCHVGDSRCYRFRDDALVQLTRDHSVINEALALRPDLSEEILKQLPSNVVTRALGMNPKVKIDTRTEPVLPGDVYLLCSDGLTGMISDEQIRGVLQRTEDLAQACERLVAGANKAGGTDNISVVLVRVVDDPTGGMRARSGEGGTLEVELGDGPASDDEIDVEVDLDDDDHDHPPPRPGADGAVSLAAPSTPALSAPIPLERSPMPPRGAVAGHIHPGARPVLPGPGPAGGRPPVYAGAYAPGLHAAAPQPGAPQPGAPQPGAPHPGAQPAARGSTAGVRDAQTEPMLAARPAAPPPVHAGGAPGLHAAPVGAPGAVGHATGGHGAGGDGRGGHAAGAAAPATPHMHLGVAPHAYPPPSVGPHSHAHPASSHPSHPRSHAAASHGWGAPVPAPPRSDVAAHDLTTTLPRTAPLPVATHPLAATHVSATPAAMGGAAMGGAAMGGAAMGGAAMGAAAMGPMGSGRGRSQTAPVLVTEAHDEPEPDDLSATVQRDGPTTIPAPDDDRRPTLLRATAPMQRIEAEDLSQTAERNAPVTPRRPASVPAQRSTPAHAPPPVVAAAAEVDLDTPTPPRGLPAAPLAAGRERAAPNRSRPMARAEGDRDGARRRTGTDEIAPVAPAGLDDEDGDEDLCRTCGYWLYAGDLYCVECGATTDLDEQPVARKVAPLAPPEPGPAVVTAPVIDIFGDGDAGPSSADLIDPIVMRRFTDPPEPDEDAASEDRCETCGFWLYAGDVFCTECGAEAELYEEDDFDDEHTHMGGP